jgi:uncharacterized protein YktA (UPF0223 family)
MPLIQGEEMNNQKLKSINSKKDAIIYLNQLITLVDKRMKRLQRGIKDISKKIDYLNDKVDKIDTEEFQRLAEAIESTTLYLFNLFADETKTAVSYKQFRKVIDKKFKNGQIEFELENLDEKITGLLTEFRNQRNWSHHVPQSLFNSQIDYFNNVMNYPPKLTEMNFSSPEIHILTWQYHQVEHLYELHVNAKKFYKEFQIVFQRIKKDYTKLVGTSMRIYREVQHEPRPSDFRRIAEKSYALNAGKIN